MTSTSQPPPLPVLPLRTPLDRVLGVGVGVLVIALGARIAVPLPGTEVPQTAQTLAVVLAGGLLGPVMGSVAVAAYLLAAALGAPVLAGGSAGPAALTGPTAGFLLGFVVAAAAVGIWAHRGLARRFGPALGGAAVAHAIILALGWAWLAVAIGGGRALEVGVAPFLVGAAVKSGLAAAIFVAVAAVGTARSAVGLGAQGPTPVQRETSPLSKPSSKTSSGT